MSALALAAAATAAALSGCVSSGAVAEGQDGGSGGSPDGVAARAVAEAADTLVQAGSSRVSTSMRMASGGTLLTITGTGVFDYARRQGQLTLELPKDAAGTEEHKPITELLTPGALYMKNRGEGVPPSKWVRMDTTRLPDGNLVTGGATEPLVAAELLRGARQVTLVGEETRDGVRVRHYRGVADIARAAGAAPAADRGPLRAAAVGFTVTRVPFDAWLDSVGRLRELSQSFTFAAAGAGPAAPDRADPPPDDAHRDDKNGAASDLADPAKLKATRPGTPGSPPADMDPAGRDPARTDSAAARSRAAGAAYRARHDVTVVSTTRYDLFGTTVIVIMPRPADIWTGKIVSAQPR
ncbi:hypothetical protein ACFO3J_01505 [Streptomyces polygonati]|uniref:Lipoprotein n=1 Tax=Streptomyces polygonati TaxID=1617087 RepID=A0ABV8HH25_9ACTN